MFCSARLRGMSVLCREVEVRSRGVTLGHMCLRPVTHRSQQLDHTLALSSVEQHEMKEVEEALSRINH